MATELLIEIFEPDADDETVDELSRDLRSGLLDLDVDSVSSVPAGPAPAGSKGLDMAAVGALLVQVKDSAQMLTAVIGLARSGCTAVARSAAR